MSNWGKQQLSQTNVQSLYRLKQRKLQKLREQRNEAELASRPKIERQPHRTCFPFYKWSREFYESRNELNLLCAANQISKSSTQIRKCIEWAINKDLWPELWAVDPNQFWYLYPTGDVATAEFKKKWMQFMPAQDDPEYGWKAENKQGQIKAIHFNTGVSVYFKSYAQDVHHLQSGTVHAIFTDEELPIELLDELLLRIGATDGYFHMVFTATLNQDFWKRAIEPGRNDTEVWEEALKIQVSMYDCLEYEDGSETPWNKEKIEKIARRCKSEEERQRRVYGRFVTEVGRIYPGFDASRHYIKPHPIPSSWTKISAVDYGSGGPKNHPSSATFIAVNPQRTKAVVYKGKRWDEEPTTQGQLLEFYQELKGKEHITLQAYDWAAKDFGTLATSVGEPFNKAEKSHELGEGILNALFQNNMLYIFDTDELGKLGGELTSLMHSTPKNKRKDDFADSARYCVMQIAWDFDAIESLQARTEVEKKSTGPMTEEELIEYNIKLRRGEVDEETDEETGDWGQLNADFAEWNSYYE